MRNASQIQLKQILLSNEQSNHQLKKAVSQKLQQNLNLENDGEKYEDETSRLHLESDDSSQDQKQKLHQQKLKQNILKYNLKLKADKKMIVGTGFSMDITEFFKFGTKEKAEKKDKESIFQQISGSSFAWIILLYSVTSGALIPGWVMNIEATKLLRKSWRFLMQTLMVIPLVLYQRRTISEEQKKKYTLSYILDPKNIIKPYISSLSASFWFLIILTSFQWTYIAHAIVLGSLSNFFLSIGRALRKSSHELQTGGQVLVIAGILLVLQDAASLTPDRMSDRDYEGINTLYINRKWFQRILADLVALGTSYVISQFSKFTSDLRDYYPPFLSMLIVNIFNCIHLTFYTFFFNGATFDFAQFWGIWSIFSNQYFSSFMYMAIVLAFGQLISLVMVTRLFPDPIIPALAMTLQPFIASFIVHLANIQNLPGDFGMIGFIFVLPGSILILVGQCLFQRQKNSKDDQEKRMKQLMQEIETLKQFNNVRKIKQREKTIKSKLSSNQDLLESKDLALALNTNLKR